MTATYESPVDILAASVVGETEVDWYNKAFSFAIIVAKRSSTVSVIFVLSGIRNEPLEMQAINLLNDRLSTRSGGSRLSCIALSCSSFILKGELSLKNTVLVESF